MSPFIINIVAGSSFAPSALPLRILGLAIFVIFFNSPFPYLLVATGNQTKLIWRNLFALIVNIVINLVLIPIFSYNGAAIATVISEIITAFISFYLVWQVLKFVPSFARIINIVAASFFSFIIGFALVKLNLIISWSQFAQYSYGMRLLAFTAVWLITTFFYIIFLILFKGVDRQIVARFLPIKNITSK